MQETWGSDRIPGSGKFSGGGNGNPLQYPCLENPMGRGAWWVTVHRTKSRWTWLKRLSTQWKMIIFSFKKKEGRKKERSKPGYRMQTSSQTSRTKTNQPEGKFGWKAWDQVHCWSHRIRASHQPNTGKGLWCPVEGRAQQKLVKFKKLLSSLLCAFPEQRGRTVLIIS